MNKVEIDAVVQFYLGLAGLKHPTVRQHSERVAHLATVVAAELGFDERAAYLAGIMHDIGKLLLPYELFEGDDISPEQYELVKEHVRLGYEALKDSMLFTGLCVGLHHAVAKKTKGYGLSPRDLPEGLSEATVKKITEIATVVSVCDCIDAYSTRRTKAHDGASDKSLEQLLTERFARHKKIASLALTKYGELYPAGLQR